MQDNFNPEMAENFAKFLGEEISPRVELSYRIGIAVKDTSPFLSNLSMLLGIYLAAQDIS